MVRNSIAAVVMLPAAVFASVVYDNGGPVTTLPGWSSNLDIDDTQIAEIFTLGSGATVTDVHWFGGIQAGIAASEFTVQIYATPLGGTPDTSTLLSETIHNAFTAVDTGLDTFFGPTVIDIFAYDVQIPDLVLPAASYAISIFESSGNFSRWSWSNTGVDSGVLFSSPIGSGSWEATGRSMAFSLTDDFAVSEPGTLALLSLGLMGIGCWRKRTTARSRQRS